MIVTAVLFNLTQASWFAQEIGLSGNDDDTKMKYILTKHYNIMVTPAEHIIKKKKQPEP